MLMKNYGEKTLKEELCLENKEGGGRRARSKAQASGACPVGVRGFESHSPHQNRTFLSLFCQKQTRQTLAVENRLQLHDFYHVFQAALLRGLLRLGVDLYQPFLCSSFSSFPGFDHEFFGNGFGGSQLL
jgi:hypothetical protein